MLSSRAKNGSGPMVIALCCAAGFAGCASSVPRREARFTSGFGGDQGAASEVVFATTPDSVGDEFFRRDASLSIYEGQAQIATAQWPEPERTSLENPRYLYLRDRDGRYTYFVPDQPNLNRYWTGWGWGR